MLESDVIMRLLAGSYVVAATAGAFHAVARGRPARFLGVRLPGTAAQHALTIGSPLSAPPIMLVALLAAAWPNPRDPTRTAWARRLSVLFLVGIAGEPDTWSTLRRPASDPIATACVVLDLALPAAVLRSARRA
jgi:hypothetical protein